MSPKVFGQRSRTVITAPPYRPNLVYNRLMSTTWYRLKAKFKPILHLFALGIRLVGAYSGPLLGDTTSSLAPDARMRQLQDYHTDSIKCFWGCIRRLVEIILGALTLLYRNSLDPCLSCRPFSSLNIDDLVAGDCILSCPVVIWELPQKSNTI